MVMMINWYRTTWDQTAIGRIYCVLITPSTEPTIHHLLTLVDLIPYIPNVFEQFCVKMKIQVRHANKHIQTYGQVMYRANVK